MKLIGPFSQILTLENLYLKGRINDSQLKVVNDGGILVDQGKVMEVGDFESMVKGGKFTELEEIESSSVLMPAFVDCHTHICFTGSRAQDFAMRNAGESYLEIAKRGGGIWSSVQSIREATEAELAANTVQRIQRHLKHGITTIEIKSGYGLNVESELKMLRAIQKAHEQTSADIVSTCLAAHIKPKDFEGNSEEYLQYIVEEILPKVQKENLSERVDIFIEETAFQTKESLHYLEKAKSMGFGLTVHADQFTSGGSQVAVEVGAYSADHLEHSTKEDIQRLAKSATSAVALPGASIGLGEKLTPARQLLDAGASLAIATDWNPGSAPQGNLLMQASMLATYEKLSTAEVLAALTFRAANALRIIDKGRLMKGQVADLQAYPTNDYRDILYHQGMMTPNQVWKNGERLSL